MKKILFVVSQLGTGGAERVIATLANYCASVGYNVTIITFRDADKTYTTSDSVKQIKLTTSRNKVLKIYQRIFAIRSYIKKNQIDIYISFELNYGFLCTSGIKTKYITSMRNDPKNEVVSTTKKFLRYLNFVLADFVVFQTEEIMSYFSRKIRKHGCVIMNPLRNGLAEFHGERDNEIVAVCRLEPQKNIPMLLDAFKKLNRRHSDYCLKIYGDGSLRQEMEALRAQEGLEKVVYFMGFQNDIEQKIKRAAMYVCSSDYEGLSNSLIEAMAIGLPCVSTDSGGGGARAVIQHGKNGYLVPVRDAETMFQYMNRIIENKEEAKSISLEASKIKGTFSEDIICQQWEALFE